MPLIVLCGFPSSGKTTLCKQLKDYLVQERQVNVIIISEDSLVEGQKNEIYKDSTQEKAIRSALRADVEKQISREDVIILDGLNYIKGFRYELHCIVKSHKTLHCVVYCGIPKERCKEWNDQRPLTDRYNEDVLEQLVMRFEPPDSRNRWDSPLFTLLADAQPQLEEIVDALFNRKAPPPNQSTMPIPLSSGNYLHELDRITQNVIKELLAAQNTAVVGEALTVSDATEKVKLLKVLNMPELRRLKRQFITYSKMHPVEDNKKIGNMFVQYINNSIR